MVNECAPFPTDFMLTARELCWSSRSAECFLPKSYKIGQTGSTGSEFSSKQANGKTKGPLSSLPPFLGKLWGTPWQLESVSQLLTRTRTVGRQRRRKQIIKETVSISLYCQTQSRSKKISALSPSLSFCTAAPSSCC